MVFPGAKNPSPHPAPLQSQGRGGPKQPGSAQAKTHDPRPLPDAGRLTGLDIHCNMKRLHFILNWTDHESGRTDAGGIRGSAEGRFDLHGRRLVLHSSDALAQLRKDLVEMVGLDQARRVFTRFGNFWGRADAAAMKRIFQWDSLTDWLLAGPRMHTLQGIVRVIVKRLEVS